MPNEVYVTPEEYLKIREISDRYQNGEIGQWTMGFLCQQIAPKLQFYADNILVVCG